MTSRMEPFRPKDHNVNNLGKGTLAEAKYQISKVNKKNFKVFFLMRVCLFVLRFYGPVNPMGSC